MFSRNRKKISILALTLASLQFASPAQARQNWYDSLKDYFKQQIGSVDFNTNPDQIQKQNIPQSTGHDKPKEKENIYLTDFNTIFAPGVITNPDIVYGGPTMLLPFRVNPASAYDPIRQRYLLVWEQAANLESSEIRAQYYSSEGVAQGSEMLVSSARPTHGCLYAGFSSDRPNLSPLSPENCQKARNPSVAYSNGKFLILWELGGTAPYAYNAHYRSEVRDGRNILVRTDETPTVNEEGKVFSNIIAKLVNADDALSPANPAGRDNNWNEGILISQFNVSVNQDYVYNRSTNRWDAFNPATAADIDVQAWWVSKNPKVAALNRVAPSDPTGFVVTWDSNRNFTDCREPLRRNSTAVFARYIDENFLGQIPSGMTNPNRPAIAISRDVSGDPANTDRRCAGDVQEAVKPKLAVLNSNDIAFTYEANTTSFPAMGTPAHSPSRIGLKKINLSTLQGSSNDNNSSDFGIIFPSMGMENQKNPDLLNYRNQIVLAYDDARSIYLQKFNTTPTLSLACPMAMSSCNPLRLVMEGDVAKTNPVLANNLNGSACPMAPAGMENSCRPDSLALNYLEADNIKLAFLNFEDFSLARSPVTLSSGSTSNVTGALSSNGIDFFSAWSGIISRRTQIFTNTTATLEALNPATLSMPNVNANLGSTNVEFTWAHPGGTGIQHTLQLAPMGMPLVDVSSCQNITALSCRVSTGLAFGQTYQWRVKTVDSRYRGREVVSAETRTFRLSVDALAAPALVTPANTTSDMPLSSNTVDFTWSHTGGGASIQYTLLLAPMGMDPVAVPTCQNISVLSCRVTGLTWGQTYQWRVSVRDSAMPLRTSVSAETRSFTLLGTLAAPVLVAPENAATLSMNSVTLEWTALMARPGLVYDVFVDDTTSGSSVSFARQTNLSTNTARIMNLLGNRTYRWWVEARDATGMRLESTTRRDFQVNDLNPPTAPALAAQPANGVTWAPTRLYLSWAAATDPDMGDSIVGYDVYFAEGTTVPSDACPYKRVSGSTTNFIIQASTDGRAAYVPDMTAPAGLSCSMTSGGARPIYLQAPDVGMPSRAYAWKVCSVNNRGLRTCSEERRFNTDDSVVGWWRFDESPTGSVCPRGLGGTTTPGGDAGETVCDYSGKGNHGVPRGNPTWLPPVMSGMAGILGGALQFDGVDDWVEVANSVSLNPTLQITIEARQSLQSVAGLMGVSRPLITKYASIDGSSRTGYSFSFGTETELYMAINENARSSYVVTDLMGIIGIQKHLIGMYDGTSGKIFVNGALSITGPFVGSIISNSAPLRIGRNASPAYFQGMMSDVLIYNRGLISDEIQNGFLSGQ